jgi:hypothetical protein
VIAVRIFLVLVVAWPAIAFAAGEAKRFESLDGAVDALIAGLRAGDRKALIGVLGSEGRALVSSGDDVADRNVFRAFVAHYDRAYRLEGGGGKVVLYVGADDFPFPIPLVPDGPRWRWDAAAGRDEILHRRIGRNELNAIQVCLAYVDAQRDYYAEDRNGDGILEYAQRLGSGPGARDGLYWPTRSGETPSPLGTLVARARAEGYPSTAGAGRPPAFHGYRYRIMLRQGPNARGGPYDYLVGRHLIGGFALIAVPAEYGVSGVMTFVVNHDGVVFQKDLGADTARAAGAISAFDPDATWQRIDHAERLRSAAPGTATGASARPSAARP